MRNPGINFNPTFDQIGTEPIDGLGDTGFQNIYCSGQVLDSYRFESDLSAFGNVGLYNPRSRDNQFVTRFRDKPSNTDEL